jgi:hypothetical protein
VRTRLAGLTLVWEGGREQMFDTSRHETRLSHRDRGLALFGKSFTDLDAANESTADVDVARGGRFSFFGHDEANDDGPPAAWGGGVIAIG